MSRAHRDLLAPVGEEPAVDCTLASAHGEGALAVGIFPGVRELLDGLVADGDDVALGGLEESEELTGLGVPVGSLEDRELLAPIHGYASLVPGVGGLVLCPVGSDERILGDGPKVLATGADELPVGSVGLLSRAEESLVLGTEAEEVERGGHGVPLGGRVALSLAASGFAEDFDGHTDGDGEERESDDREEDESHGVLQSFR